MRKLRECRAPQGLARSGKRGSNRPCVAPPRTPLWMCQARSGPRPGSDGADEPRNFRLHRLAESIPRQGIGKVEFLGDLVSGEPILGPPSQLVGFDRAGGHDHDDHPLTPFRVVHAPTTATSLTASCPSKTASISNADTFSPPILRMSADDRQDSIPAVLDHRGVPGPKPSVVGKGVVARFHNRLGISVPTISTVGCRWRRLRRGSQRWPV